MAPDTAPSRDGGPKPLLLCYVSGLDLRRVEPGSTPVLSGLLASCPCVPLANLPSNELFPTLVTGVYPTEHGVWGVRLHPNGARGAVAKALDRLPDALTTTAQCLLHAITGSFDLAAIPPRRRRRFTITRTKYPRRRGRPEALYRIGGCETILGAVGRERARYAFTTDVRPEGVLGQLAGEECALEVLELYSLDRFQQWNLDDPAAVQSFYTRIDSFLEALLELCRERGRRVLIVSDHGHEPVRGSVDVLGTLADLDLGSDDWSYFIEVSSARFWFRDESVRRAVCERLAALPHATLVRWDEMERYHIPLADPSYGEIFLFLDPGWVIFPHDFHHPLANLYLGLRHRTQRSRLRDARHRGNHGHLPGCDAERAFALLADPACRATTEAGDLIDVAPSVLALLERPPLETMRGRPLFALPTRS